MAFVHLLTRYSKSMSRYQTALIYVAYKQCVTPASVAPMFGHFDPAKDLDNKVTALICNCIRRGHLSPLEHVQLTFNIEDISRVASHQLVRHRIASYSQQSQRYTEMEMSAWGLGNVHLPPKVWDWYDKHQEAAKNLELALAAYDQMIRDGVPSEDARYILPEGTTSNIVVTMNLRSLLHFFNERLCSSAQEEIRDIAGQMAELTTEMFPWLSEFIGPKCIGSDHCLNSAEPDAPLCEEHYRWRDDEDE